MKWTGRLPAPLPPPRFVLFDLVGTLLDERADHKALDVAMKQVRRRFTLNVPARELSGRFSLALMEIVRSEPDAHEDVPFLPFREAAPDIFAGLLQAEGRHVTPADKQWFWTMYLDAQRGAWRTYREVPRVLRRLARTGVRMGVVTDADRYMIDDIMPRLGLDRFLPTAVAAEDAGRVKPDPALFSLALDRAGVAAEDTVMVGDSYERDLQGAAAAGIRRLVLVDRHRARTVEVPRIADLRGLPALLDGPVRPGQTVL